MNINEIRKKNYGVLLAKFEEKESRDGLASRGSLNRFGEFVGISAAYLSHVNNDRKNLGSDSTRQMENAFKLPAGWMDVDHSQGTDPMGKAEIEFTRLALRLFRESPVEAQAVLLRYMADRMLSAPARGSVPG